MSMSTLPHAAPQSNVLLAISKDDFYVNQLQSAMSDVVEKVKFWGRSDSPTSALQASFEPELQLLAQLLYFLTTGTQSMGEEYCEIYRVKQAGEMPQVVGRTRKLTWLVLDTIFPYLKQRSSLGWARLFPGEQERRLQEARMRAREQLQLRRQDPSSTVISAPVEPTEAKQEDWVDAWLKNADNMAKSVREYLKKLEERCGFSVESLVQGLMQCHVAFFFIHGNYYHISKRLTSLRYVLTQKISQSPAQFAVLGYMILIRMAITSFLQLPTLIQCIVGQKMLQQSSPPTSAGKRVPIDTTISLKQSKKCALCLTERSYPSMTPCGHVFCWECIVGWCQSKPECPLCRQLVLPQDVKCLYNYQ